VQKFHLISFLEWFDSNSRISLHSSENAWECCVKYRPEVIALVVIVSSAAALFASVPARAEFVDGRALNAACVSGNNTYVEAFVAGTADKNSQDISALLDFSNIATDFPRARLPVLMSVIGHYCMPAGVSVQQAAATVCAYLKMSVDQERQAAAKLVVQALKQAYPCQGSR
jgi:hypothetical protein